jgi:hypothetical protein
MLVRNVALALAAAAIPCAGAPAMAAGGASVKLELTITVEVPTRKSTGQDQAFLAGFERDLAARTRQGAARAELAQLAAAKMGSYPRAASLLGRPGKPSAAEVEVSFTLTIKAGKKQLEARDARFVRQLEAELSRDLGSGRIAPSGVEAQVKQRLAEYTAQQGSAAGPGWDKPGVSVLISITVKF